MSKKKIKFLKSPTGAYGMAYHTGQVAHVPVKRANELIKNGFAEEASKSSGPAKKKETAPDATNAALTLIQDNDLDISRIKGTGKDGKITKGDVEDFIEKA